MIDFSDQFFKRIISAVVTTGLVGWVVAKIRDMYDRGKVYRWLRSNTLDQPGESYVDTVTLAKGTRLPEKRETLRLYVRQTPPSFPEGARTLERVAQGTAERLRVEMWFEILSAARMDR